jgi:UPF0176 protein
MILNVAFYRFVPVRDVSALRMSLRARLRELGMRGTILLAPEGINGSLAGEEASVREFQRGLEADPRFAEIAYKEFISDEVPFGRLLVKAKKEIIPMGEGVDPLAVTGARLAPRELKRWIDEGRSFTLLDTRNDYEMEHGSFAGARKLPLRHFRDFPRLLEERRAEFEKAPLVMFCTGGIRCEKATAYALKLGLSAVYQLEGGILGYFNECGGEHYEGKCFVFDERVAVAPRLEAREEGRA